MFLPGFLLFCVVIWVPLLSGQRDILTCHQICGETASWRHPLQNIWVLVHHHQCGLSVHSWPLHHGIILPTGQVKVKPNIVPCVITVTGQRYDTYAVSIAFTAVEAGAVDNSVDISHFHDPGEVTDCPHRVWASCLNQADVVYVDASSGSSGVSTYGLEGIAKFNPYFQWNMGDLPWLLRIHWVDSKG